MPKEQKDPDTTTELFPQLRSYPAPWKGELLLYCTKCSRKWKKSGKKGFVDVRKGLKKRSKASEEGPKLRMIGVGCVKMCPKNAVTVTTREQLGSTPATVSIIHNEADLDALYARLEQISSR